MGFIYTQTFQNLIKMDITCSGRLNMRPASEDTKTSVISKPKLTIFQRHRGRRIRKYFREYCERTGIHGLRYVAEKERSMCERVLWMTLILIAVGVCGYMISRIYHKYEKSPVIVSFATKESPIFNIPFPAVTVCTMSKTYTAKLNYTGVLHKLKANKSLTPEEELNGQYMSLVCDKGTDAFPNNKTFTDDFFTKFEQIHKPAADFLPCYFMEKLIACYNLFKPILTDEGLCYTFNMLDREEIFRDNVVHYSKFHKTNDVSNWYIDHGYTDQKKIDNYPKRALLAGADNALEIMFVQKAEDIDYRCVKDVQGFRFILHPPHTIPRPKKQYFHIPFDTVITAVVQPRMITTSQNVQKYDPFIRECYFANERPLKFFKIYSAENCRLECLTNHTLKKCGCVNFFMPRDNETLICGNGNYKCMKKAERQLMSIEIRHLINSKVYCDCMPSCTELSYELDQSQVDWDWDESARSYGSKQKSGWMYSKLTVYFKSEQFWTTERNELYGPTDFLANFGGLLGLFTGFSLLSLVEIIYFLTLRIFCNIRKYKGWSGPAEH